MHLSVDGRTLIEVTNDDLHEGQFIIPDTVTTIGDEAFKKCTGLTTVSIPQGVTIGNRAFEDCTGLTTLSIPEGVRVGKGAFYGCIGLTVLSIPEGVTVGRGAFIGCTGLNALSIPQGVRVGKRAFSRCTGLTTLSLAEGVTVGDWAFSRCTGLTTLSLAEGVTLGYWVFTECIALTRIIVDTDQDAKLTRIKNLFPEHQHPQFMKKSVYDQVRCLQDKAYQQLMQEPWVSGLFPLYEHLKLIPDILLHINAQEGADHLTYRLFHEEVAQLNFPTEEGALAAYQQQLQAIVEDIKAQTIAQIIEVQKTQCVAKLQGYVRTVEDLMQHKLSQHPGFFATEHALHTKLAGKIIAVYQLIQHLQGDKTVTLSPEAIDELRTGFVGQTLARFDVRLNELAEQQALAQFRKAYHSRLRDDQRRCFGSWRRSRLNLDAEGVRLQDIFDHALRNQGHRTRAVLQQLGWLDAQGQILESIRELMTEDKIQQESSPKLP